MLNPTRSTSVIVNQVIRPEPLPAGLLKSIRALTGSSMHPVVPGTNGHTSQRSPIPSPSASACDGLGIEGQLSQALPIPSSSVSACAVLADEGQLSQTSPTPSASASAWFGLLTNGQLSFSQTMRSPSASHPMSVSSTSPLQ